MYYPKSGFLKKISTNGIPGYLVLLDSQDLQAAAEYKANCWSTIEKTKRYSYKSDYTKGVNPDAARIGKLGEIGTAKLSGVGVDISYREFGDEGVDLYSKEIDLYTGRTLDVKTKPWTPRFGELDNHFHMIVAYENRDNYSHRVEAQNYISCVLFEEAPGLISPGVLVVGHRPKEYIQNLHQVSSRRDGATWKNREWATTDVEPITNILKVLGDEDSSDS